MYKLRREATDFYRAVHPLLSVVTHHPAHRGGQELKELRPICATCDNLTLVDEDVTAQRDCCARSWKPRWR